MKTYQAHAKFYKQQSILPSYINSHSILYNIQLLSCTHSLSYCFSYSPSIRKIQKQNNSHISYTNTITQKILKTKSPLTQFMKVNYNNQIWYFYLLALSTQFQKRNSFEYLYYQGQKYFYLIGKVINEPQEEIPQTLQYIQQFECEQIYCLDSQNLQTDSEHILIFYYIQCDQPKGKTFYFNTLINFPQSSAISDEYYCSPESQTVKFIFLISLYNQISILSFFSKEPVSSEVIPIEIIQITMSNQKNCRKKCVGCFQQEGDCLTCNTYHIDSPECQNCNDNYYFETKSGTCELCDIQCKTCQKQKNQCVECAVDYLDPPCFCLTGTFTLIVNGQYTCNDCLTQCESCKELKKCLTCKDKLKRPPSCDFCGIGFKLVNKECQKIECDQQCVDCSGNPSACLQCSEQFIVPPECNICADPTHFYDDRDSICKACEPQCQRCFEKRSRCSTCTDPLSSIPYCLDCPITHYYKDYGCHNCGQQCFGCIEYADQCIECYDNYFIPPNCIKDIQTLCIFHCDQCHQIYDQCLACEDEYILFDSACYKINYEFKAIVSEKSVKLKLNIISSNPKEKIYSQLTNRGQLFTVNGIDEEEMIYPKKNQLLEVSANQIQENYEFLFFIQSVGSDISLLKFVSHFTNISNSRIEIQSQPFQIRYCPIYQHFFQGSGKCEINMLYLYHIHQNNETFRIKQSQSLSLISDFFLRGAGYYLKVLGLFSLISNYHQQIAILSLIDRNDSPISYEAQRIFASLVFTGNISNYPEYLQLSHTLSLRQSNITSNSFESQPYMIFIIIGLLIVQSFINFFYYFVKTDTNALLQKHIDIYIQLNSDSQTQMTWLLNRQNNIWVLIDFFIESFMLNILLTAIITQINHDPLELFGYFLNLLIIVVAFLRRIYCSYRLWKFQVELINYEILQQFIIKKFYLLIYCIKIQSKTQIFYPVIAILKKIMMVVVIVSIPEHTITLYSYILSLSVIFLILEIVFRPYKNLAYQIARIIANSVFIMLIVVKLINEIKGQIIARKVYHADEDYENFNEVGKNIALMMLFGYICWFITKIITLIIFFIELYKRKRQNLIGNAAKNVEDFKEEL